LTGDIKRRIGSGDGGAAGARGERCPWEYISQQCFWFGNETYGTVAGSALRPEGHVLKEDGACGRGPAGARGGAEVGWVRQLHSTGPRGMRLGWGRGCGKAACGQAAGTCNGVQERWASRPGGGCRWRRRQVVKQCGPSGLVGRLLGGSAMAGVQPRSPAWLAIASRAVAAPGRGRRVGLQRAGDVELLARAICRSTGRRCHGLVSGCRRGSASIRTARGLCRRWGSRGRLLWPRPAGGPR
jgi:hypothetical protein